MIQQKKIAIIGLGYVGLPLAVEFGRFRSVVGFDINAARIAELKLGRDSTREVERVQLEEAQFLQFSSDVNDIADADIYIVTVPTPVDEVNRPDLRPLKKASEMIGKVVGKGNIIIYESTVYPGATEEDCIPVVEEVSGLKFNVDFFAGYSPERVNPGDKVRRLPDIQKITSGSTPAVADEVDHLYKEIITAGTFKATSIKVAEAAKVIENVQRDVNIALINELYQIFELMGINTNDVIDAASTKWNFMKLRPGLVGGHCIGVDPYYLLHRSQSVGYIPDLIRSAREINDGMVEFISNQFVAALLKNEINPVKLKVMILGFSFKENCPDVRNTKVYHLFLKLQRMGFDVAVYDPLVDPEHVFDEFGVRLCDLAGYSAGVGILAVPHQQIIDEIENRTITFSQDFCFDFKSVL